MTEAKALSLSEIRSKLDAFASGWKDETSERAEAQTFWNEFLECFGVKRRQVAVFERRAKRASTGHVGRVDVFWPRMMIAEHKSPGAMTEDSADAQAEDYLAGGDVKKSEYPRYIISSDFQSIRLTDLEAAPGSKPLHIPLTKLRDEAEAFSWIAGYQARKFADEEEEKASVEAANLMADLYVALTGDADEENHEAEDDESEESQSASVLLTRLLFLMFGDRAGLWDRRLFRTFIEDRTAEDGSDLGAQLNALFDVLNTSTRGRPGKVDPALAAFPYVNGALYAGREATQFFDRAMRGALLRACKFDWSAISPAVFGSLFQSIKSREARRLSGEHYTTEINVLKTIGPLFLDDLRARVRTAWDNPKQLREIHVGLADMQYLDPACGCGNFLIVAYREMRAIELDILVRLRALEGRTGYQSIQGVWELKVSLDQFHGIEINWWPAKIAEVAMFLVDHQANREMAAALGQAPDRLPITITADIHHANALTLDWRKVLTPTDKTFVFGNPPFVGQKEKEVQQKTDLQTAWGSGFDGYLDYVTGWYAKANHFFTDSDGQWAFVSTNSVTQGQPVRALFRPLFSARWRIKFAHRTFEWTSEAPGKAAVHCVIIGFTRDATTSPRLFDYATVKSEPHEVPATFINAYLVDGPNVLVEKRMAPLSPGLPEIESGSKAVDWKYYTIEDPKEHERLSEDPIASKYLHLYLGGDELINGEERWCLWLVDAAPGDIDGSLELKHRVAEVKELRLKSKRPATLKAAATPQLFGERRQPTVPYLGIPQTFSESRAWATAARLDTDVIASIKLFTATDADGYLFAVVSSSMFITWQKTVGGRMKSDPSFSNTIVWNNLPLPPIAEGHRKRIIAAGARVLDARAMRPDRSLAEHYNPRAMDPALVAAHRALDAVVDRAFGAPRRLTTERERQALLFKNFQEMTNPLGIETIPNETKVGGGKRAPKKAPAQATSS